MPCKPGIEENMKDGKRVIEGMKGEIRTYLGIDEISD